MEGRDCSGLVEGENVSGEDVGEAGTAVGAILTTGEELGIEEGVYVLYIGAVLGGDVRGTVGEGWYSYSSFVGFRVGAILGLEDFGRRVGYEVGPLVVGDELVGNSVGILIRLVGRGVMIGDAVGSHTIAYLGSGQSQRITCMIFNGSGLVRNRFNL